MSTYLFQLNGNNYLVLVDRYSDYSERKPLRNTLASTVIRAMKRNFARNADECITDNGPQFASRMLASTGLPVQNRHPTTAKKMGRQNQQLGFPRIF